MTGSAEEIVGNTRAIRFWIDEQIAKGRTDEEIQAELPVAAAFITGKLGYGDLLALGLRGERE